MAMMIGKLVLNGKIGYCWGNGGFGDLMIGDCIIAKKLNELHFNGKVHLRYMVSDNPIKESLDELWTKKYYGILEAEHYGIFGSEWTGQYDVHEEITIGGHSLFEELNEHEGRYCRVEIWESE